MEGGCGAGAVLDYLQRATGGQLDVYGVDITPELVSVARRRVHGGGVFWLGDIVSPYAFRNCPSQSFDLVVSMGVFIHLNSKEDATNAIENLYGLVKPGGLLMIGYVMDEQNIKVVEKNRKSSKRKVEMEKLLQTKMPSYLYLGHTFFVELGERLGAEVETYVLEEQLKDVPEFQKLPKSFYNRRSVYIRRPNRSSL